MIRVPFTITHPDLTPIQAHPGDAGMDLRAAEAGHLMAGERRLVPTGLRVAIPAGYEGQVRPRSGLALRYGLTIPNSPGTVDSSYRGPVGVILHAAGASVRWERGDRIAQLVIVPVPQVELVAVESLDETERGTGGFGSTGVS